MCTLCEAEERWLFLARGEECSRHDRGWTGQRVLAPCPDCSVEHERQAYFRLFEPLEVTEEEAHRLRERGDLAGSLLAVRCVARPGGETWFWDLVHVVLPLRVGVG